MIAYLGLKTKTALLAIQRYARTDMLYVARGGFWLSFQTFVGVITSFLLAIAFANLLPKETYGSYRFVLSLAGVIFIFSLTGLGASLTRSVAKGYVGVLKTAMRKTLLWSVGMSAAAFSLAVYYRINDNRVLAASLIIVGLLAPLMNAFSVYKPYLHGKKQFKKIATSGIAQSVAPAAVMLTALLFTNDVVVLVLTYFLANTLTVAILYVFFLASEKDEPSWDSEVIPYAKQLSIMNLMSTVAAHADKIIIFHFLGAAETAIYTFALAIPDQLKGAVKNLGSLALPKLSEKTMGSARRGMRRKSLILAMLFGTASILYIVLARPLFSVFFPAYIDAVPYSQVLAINVFLSGLVLLPATLLTAQAAVREKYILGSVTPALRIILMLALVGPYHIWGIVLAFVGTRIIGTGLTLFLARRAQ